MPSQLLLLAGRLASLPAACTAALLLAGCGSGDDAAPGDMTVGEQRAVDDAGDMLDEQRPQGTPGFAEPPPAESPSPAAT